MLTGYTTSVEFEGVTYHVQTEDKGSDSAVIVSLVYEGGTVLATKRTSYSDLMATGLDKDLLAKRIRQQHKLMCAALLAGRLDDLKKIADRESQRSGTRGGSASKAAGTTELRQPRGTKKLSIKIARGLRFKGGEHKSLEVTVTDPTSGKPIKGAQVTAKLVGSEFRALILHSRSEETGMATFHLRIPVFSTGRGALIVSAVHGEDEAELRRVVRPS